MKIPFVRKYLIISFLFSCINLFSQDTNYSVTTNYGFNFSEEDFQNGITLSDLLINGPNSHDLKNSTKWKYKKGDNLNWSNPEFDDSNWDSLDIALDLTKIPPEKFNGNCWFRTEIVLDSSWIGKPIALNMQHLGASEFYIDGNLAFQYGKIGHPKQPEETKNIEFNVVAVWFNENKNHVIAIRYSNQKYKHYLQKFNENQAGITFLKLHKSLNPLLYLFSRIRSLGEIVSSLLFGFLTSLMLLHLLLFLYHKKNKTNLYFGLFVFFYSLYFFRSGIMFLPLFSVEAKLLINLYFPFFPFLSILTLIVFLYSLFYNQFQKKHLIAPIITIVAILNLLITSNTELIGLIIDIICWLLLIVELLRLIIIGVIKNYPGARIVGSVLGSALLLFAICFVFFAFKLNIPQLLSTFSGILLVLSMAVLILLFPISMSIYLAKEFSLVNKSLQAEKENLEIRVTERTAEVVEQKRIIEEKNHEIIDSITYAKRIQNAILPPNKAIKKHLNNSFVLYKPKDIVAGDFYWLETEPSKSNDLETIIFAAADCTGHGVPGAMVSIVCNNALNRSVKEFGLTDPGKVLDKTREIVIQEFEKSNEEVKDGMDIALCQLQGNKLLYAGANNPIWIVKNGELIETKANKQPIGKYENPEPFTTHTFNLEKGDTFYIFTDGFVDQFGGEKNKKFKARAFKELLLSLQKESMDTQKITIDKVFENWKGDVEQIDDVCVIGVRI